jgi:DNA-binding response OmpR family regulator
MSQRKRILVVDDDPDIRLLLKGRLESLGYEVFLAATGEEGLLAARSDPPDLILLDVMMPKMKGREVCAHLKADPATAPIPVIFLSALGMADHIQAGMNLGAADYIVKPFNPDELERHITICLARHEKNPPSK